MHGGAWRRDTKSYFELAHLHKYGCKSSSYEIYTHFYTPKSMILNTTTFQKSLEIMVLCALYWHNEPLFLP